MADRQIPLFKVFMAEDAPRAVEKVLRSGYIGQGPKVEEFERLIEDHLGNPWVNTLNSATSGLHLALHMFRNGCRSAEVLTTPLTCTATNWAILAAGLKPRWVDVDPMTGNMDLDDLERKIGPNTLAVMLVHWGGYPCDLDRVRQIQERCLEGQGFLPPVIEDCAHAWGATYKGQPVGTHGNACVFSFQAIKHLTTGDGGCLVSPDEEHYRRAKLLRWYGLDRESSADFRCAQNAKEWGFKFHMNDIAAAIGVSNFPHAQGLVEKYRANGRFYNERLKGVPGLTMLGDAPDRESSFWVYTVRVQNREGFCRKMKECGVATSQVHARNDLHDCVREFRCELPNLDVFSREMICIPCGWWVTEEDREYVVNCVRAGW